MIKAAHEPAMRYEQLLSRQGMRANALRVQVLEALVNETEFIDALLLKEKLEKNGVASESEKIRYVIKRLSAAGFLEKKPVAKMNKYLFRLYPVEMLEKQFTIR
jgi:Fe2+ or Zn2+ uptake regulation protein